MSKELPALGAYKEHFRLLDTISDGHVSRLQTIESGGQKFVLKRYPLWFDASDIRFIHEYTRFLIEGGINTPKLIQTARGATFTQEHREIFSVYEYIEGEKVEARDLEIMADVGCAFGRIHKVSSQYVPPVARRWWTAETYKAKSYFREAESLITDGGHKSLTSKVDLLKAGYTEVRSLLLDSNKYPQLEKLAIHGNFDDGNVMLVGGQICVFDFDNAREEIREMDFVDPLRHFCRMPREGWQDRAHEFMNGYIKGSGRSDLDSEAILACTLLSCLQEGSWQLRQFLKTEGGEEHKDLMNTELGYLETVMSNKKNVQQTLKSILS